MKQGQKNNQLIEQELLPRKNTSSYRTTGGSVPFPAAPPPLPPTTPTETPPDAPPAPLAVDTVVACNLPAAVDVTCVSKNTITFAGLVLHITSKTQSSESFIKHR